MNTSILLRAAGALILLAAFFFVRPVPTPMVFGQDAVPPELSRIRIVDIGVTSTVITWDTNEPSNSLVNVAGAKNLGIFREPDPTVTAHEVVVTDLEPATTYYLRVMSADTAGNQSFSGTYQFTTKGTKQVKNLEEISNAEQQQITQKITELVSQVTDRTALEIVNREVQEAGEGALAPPRILGDPDLVVGVDEVTVRWETDRAANSVVEFADEASYGGGGYDRKEGDADEQTTSHEIVLHGLRPLTTYHYQITSRSTVGPTGSTGDRTFTTKSVLPQIFSMRMSKVEEESATITWSTQVPAAGIVEYTNLNTKEAKSIGDPSLQLTHTVRLPDLKFKSPYQAIIRARTQAGDEITSQPLTFVTKKDDEPPVIGQVNNESTLYPGADAKVQTIVSWETDELSVCQFFYTDGVTVDEETALSLPEETGALMKHVQVVTEFTPSTAYKFWVRCRDRNGNPARSEDFVLFTPEKEKNIIDILLENFEGAFGWVKNVGK